MTKTFDWAIVGGAGFIGSHFVEYLLGAGKSILVYDNLSSGGLRLLGENLKDPKFSFVRGEAADTSHLSRVFSQCRGVIHLASNPDIAKAQINPRIDFVEGTVLTESVCEASRLAEVKRIIYASGSGVYKESPTLILAEDSALEPISTYGASKLAGEALMLAYSHMFEIKTSIFRFANVVGPRQTHGVGFDFLRKLAANPKSLKILGNGNQTKSYVHVTDVVRGVLGASDSQEKISDIFNIANRDTITVREIARLAIQVSGLDVENVEIISDNQDRGWKGDVPTIFLNSEKIRSIGWKENFNSEQAMLNSLQSMLEELRDLNPQ